MPTVLRLSFSGGNALIKVDATLFLNFKTFGLGCFWVFLKTFFKSLLVNVTNLVYLDMGKGVQKKSLLGMRGFS